MKNNQDIDTMLAQADHYIDAQTGAITPPIHSSTTYARDDSYKVIGDYSYSRDNNPTYMQVERLCAQLEGGEQARVFASGMAGIASALETLRSGGHIVAPQIMYHGTQDWLRRLAERRNIELSFYDANAPGALADAIRPAQTSMVWIESSVNPTWAVIDIAEAAQIAHAHDACLVVDSTVSPPVTTRPLSLGADIVFHSATKYLNGHSDVTAGVLVTDKNDTRWQEICNVRKLMGGVLGAFESWLLLRGMRTLAVRFARASSTAQLIAEEFHGHPALEAVLYPGLPSHPTHAIAKRQMTNGYGGMLSLLVKGDFAATQAVATRLNVFVRATSLGGVESLAEHRAAVEGPHSLVPKNLLRLSIGLESPNDLTADLHQALAAVA